MPVYVWKKKLKKKVCSGQGITSVTIIVYYNIDDNVDIIQLMIVLLFGFPFTEG